MEHHVDLVLNINPFLYLDNSEKFTRTNFEAFVAKYKSDNTMLSYGINLRISNIVKLSVLPRNININDYYHILNTILYNFIDRLFNTNNDAIVEYIDHNGATISYQNSPCSLLLIGLLKLRTCDNLEYYFDIKFKSNNQNILCLLNQYIDHLVTIINTNNYDRHSNDLFMTTE